MKIKLKKKPNILAPAIALSMVTGAAIGAAGAVAIPEISKCKCFKKAKKSIKKYTDKAMETAEDIINSIPNFM